MTKPKILIIDIETRPTKAYVWRAYKENVSPDQVIEPGRAICFGAKWFGERNVMFHADWIDGYEPMLAAAHALLSEADGVVTFNGDKFDLPKLFGEFAQAGFDPNPPPTSIDVIKTIKKFGLFMNRLAHVGPLFGAGSKVSHEGFPLWTKVMDGDPKAQKRMQTYCIGDVRVLEKLYRNILPYIRNHPHMGDTKSTACGACGSHKTQKRGFRRTRAFRIQRLQCTSCGSWQDGKREKMAV